MANGTYYHDGEGWKPTHSRPPLRRPNGATSGGGNGSDSGENQNYYLPVGGDELGGVKNGGNVVINADGTMTAPDNAPTDEQVGAAVNDYLTAHPEATTTVADKSIGPEKLTDELAGMIFKEIETVTVPVASESRDSTYINKNGDLTEAATHTTWAYPVPDGVDTVQITAKRSRVDYWACSTATDLASYSADANLTIGQYTHAVSTDIPVPAGTVTFFVSSLGIISIEFVAHSKRGISEDVQELKAVMPLAQTAVQPEDLVPAVIDAPAAFNGFTPLVAKTGYGLGWETTRLNSIAASDEWLRSQIRLGSSYAHCPSINVKSGVAYVSAFQNTTRPADFYTDEGSSSELWLVDITTDPMTVLAQHKLAGHGDTVGELTFAYGSGACQSVFISDTILRSVFVALLQDADGAEEWYQCYRDFDITTNTLGDIQLCQIQDTDGGLHPFTTANASAYIQAIGNILDTDGKPINTNIVCQPAQVDGVWYVGCGCRDKWANMPILTTTDWITFQHWATPVTENNHAHFEMAIAADGNGYLYTATRQTSAGTLLISKIEIADPAEAVTHAYIPDGNPARPFIIMGTQARMYVFHIASEYRDDCAQVSELNVHGIYLGAKSILSLPPAVYPSVAQLEDGSYLAAYMVPKMLCLSKFSALQRYSSQEAVAILAKQLEVSGG